MSCSIQEGALIRPIFIFLSISLAFILFSIAWAVDDSAIVSATVNPKIVVDSPDIKFDPLKPGDIAYTDEFEVVVSSNKNWQLDVSAANGGYLAMSGGLKLANPLLIRKASSYIDMTSQKNMMNGAKPGGILSSELMQIVLYYDSPGEYSTTLSFIATQP